MLLTTVLISMSDAGYNGIEELMKAEQEAAAIVQEARQSNASAELDLSF